MGANSGSIFGGGLLFLNIARSRRLLSSLVILSLSVISGVSAGTENCLSDGALAGIVFGCIFGTIVVMTCLVVGLWFWKFKRDGYFDYADNSKVGGSQSKDETTTYAYENPQFRGEHGGKVDLRSRTESDLGKRKKEGFLTGFLHSTKRKDQPLEAKSTECIPTAEEVVQVNLKSRDFTGLGLSIYGNMRDGIFVKEVLSRGPAKDSGKIHAGDRILKATVSFENMVLEDALTILSYASPYAVSLDVQKHDVRNRKPSLPQQRPSSNNRSSASSKSQRTSPSDQDSPSEQRPQKAHPLYKSQSTDDINFHSGSGKTGQEAKRTKSAPKTQQDDLTEEEPMPKSTAQSPASSLKHPPVVAMESISETEAPDRPAEASPKMTVRAEVHPPVRASASTGHTGNKEPPMTPKTKLRAEKTAADPYADLSPEERLQVLRLSYEDPELTQSTPNLYHPSLAPVAVHIDDSELIKAEVLEPSDTEGSRVPEVEGNHQKLERSDSVGKKSAQSIDSGTSADLIEAKNKLEARKAALLANSDSTSDSVTVVSGADSAQKPTAVENDFREAYSRAIPPPPPSGMNFESWEVSKSPNSSSTNDSGFENQLESIKFVDSDSISSDTTNAKPAAIHEKTVVMTNGGSAIPCDHVSATKSDQSALRGKLPNGQPLDNGDATTENGTEIDREQYQKLLYFQQQLAKQHEELTQMGIHIPINLNKSNVQKQKNGEIVHNGIH